jgi:hypothetical protein
MITTQRQQQRQPCHDQTLVDRVASELESIRYVDINHCNSNPSCSSSTSSCRNRNTGSNGIYPNSIKSSGHHNDIGVKFPTACLQLLQSIPGNQNCVDCGKCNPDWASITYGVLMCLQCSGVHRSYGVQISYIRSIQYDTWNHHQIVSLLEGGNTQLRTFFHRHQLLNNNNDALKASYNYHALQQQQHLYNQRYHTKAALYYKVHLKQHVSNVIQNGEYRGREYNRQHANSNSNSCCSSSTKGVEYRSKSPTSVVVVHSNKTPVHS